MDKISTTLSLHPEVKKRLTQYAKNIGTNPNSLLNMIVIQYVEKPKETYSFLDLEFEPFSDVEIENMNDDKELQESIQKMEGLLDNYKKQGILS